MKKIVILAKKYGLAYGHNMIVVTISWLLVANLTDLYF